MKNLFNGFTLAEVLITLGIIGVVAAITIPTLMANLRATKLKSQFEKTYADLNVASRAFYADNDMTFREYQDSIYTGSLSSQESLKYFMSYFKGEQTQSYEERKDLKNLNLNGQETTLRPCDMSNIEKDISGRLYSMDDNAAVSGISTGPKICVDINGVDRPNKWGVDRFVFVFTDTAAVVPYTGTSWNGLTEQTTDEEILAQYCSTSQVRPVHTCAYFAHKNISPTGKGDYWHDFLRGK
mgnify:CR=1 FL=1